MKRRPAARAALLVACGILLGRIVSPAPLLVAGIVVLTVVLLFVAYRRWPAVATVALAAAVLGLGMFRETERSAGWEKISLRPTEGGRHALLKGRIITSPQSNDNRVRFILALDNPDSIRQAVGVPLERVVVSARKKPENQPLIQIGDRVELPAILDPPVRPRNPGDVDIGWYYRYHGIGAVAYATLDSVLVMNENGSFSLATMLLQTQRSLHHTVNEYYRGEQAQFLLGVLLGDRSQITPETREAFLRAGTAHVLAVSGLHVGVIVLSLYAFLGLMRIPRRLVVVGTMIGAIAYMMVTGASPSVVRATLMSIVLLLGYLLERRVDIYQAIGLAALILLLIDPQELFHPGFQLSFAAVISIVYLYPRVSHALAGSLKSLWDRPVGKAIGQLFAVTLAAFVGTFPLTVLHFESVPLLSILVNLAVVPLVGVIIPLGLATLAAAPLAAWLAHTVAIVNHYLITLLLGVVNIVSSLSFATVKTHSITIPGVILFYIGLIMVTNLKGKALARGLVIGGLVVANLFMIRGLGESNRPALEVSMIDVGQGDAILIQTPRGRSILVDTGPTSPTFDAGERVITPFLNHKGIEQLDLLILTHPHSDHIGGAHALMTRIGVGRILISGEESSSRMYHAILQEADGAGIPIVRVSRGQMIDVDPSLRCYVLYAGIEQGSSSTMNNTSIVMKIVYGHCSLLLTGDVEDEGEAVMGRRYGRFLDVDILKVGHHGSRTSSSPAFLDLVSPETALISTGRRNRFGHPSPEVVRALEQHHADVHRTDIEGAVVLRTDGYSIESINWRGQY